MPIIRQAIYIITLINIGLISFASTADMVTKDGRQYTFDLKKRLQIDQAGDLEKMFLDLRQNLPKQNNLGAMASGLDAIAKIAAAGCSYAAYFQQDWTDVDGLYKAMLDRAPTATEKASAIRDAAGTLVFFPNCFMVALHPEFLTRK
jgi:hypothetical protein